jgi:hypothetical protein
MRQFKSGSIHRRFICTTAIQLTPDQAVIRAPKFFER